MVLNVVTAVFGAFRSVKTAPLWQYDYGQILRFRGLTLPEAYEVHFSNSISGASKTKIGNANGVLIPDEYLTNGASVYAWVFLHVGDSDGETRYMVEIPINKRAKPTDEAPTPKQQSEITQTIAALNAAVDKAELAAKSIENMSVSAHSVTGGPTVDKTVSKEGAVNLDFGIPSGGSGLPVNYGDGLKYNWSTNTVSVDTASAVQAGNTKPITSAAVYTEVGNIDALLQTI